MHKPIPLDADTGEEVTVEMALEQARRAGDMATDLAGALEEARALLIQVLAIEPHELEPPILKEQGDLAAAKKMDRKLLEEKYALASMTARLSMKKAEDLEGDRDELANRVDFLNMQNSAQQEQLDELEIQAAQLSARLVESDVERDRLAAHAERIKECKAERDSCRGSLLLEWDRALDAAIDDAPTTSLDRRDAEQQVEGMHRVVCVLEAEFDPCHPIVERAESLPREARRQLESEQKSAQNEAISQESEQKGAQSSQVATQ